MPSGADTSTISTVANPFGANQSGSDYDALAELFLGGRQPSPRKRLRLDDPGRDKGASTCAASDTTARSAPPDVDAGRNAKIEALILGHLPTMASPWASQYAAALAEKLAEPVGLIRLADHELSVELIGRSDPPGAPAPMAEAIGRVCAVAPRVLVHVDAVAEPAVAAWADLDAVTMLTGADDAAVVSAYRAIKGIASQRPAEAPAKLQAAIMGADAVSARRAMRSLSRAVAAHLDGELVEAPSVSRIGPVRRTALCRERFDEPIERLLELLAGGERSLGADRAAEAEHLFIKDEQDQTVRAAPRLAPERTSKTLRLNTDEPDRATAAPSLASYLAGLCALETRCPFAPSIELAADEDGDLHLLARGDAGAIGDLLAVEAWACDHALILVRAEPRLTALVMHPKPTLHLFTDRPSNVRRLLDTRLCVHLLAHGDADGVVCAPLNDPG